ncbi:tetratricopeptide repeat protein [Streptomyces sp. NPDC048751]|uniref:tetratricopeptide repeat protein n=1 Tax=Streptomyces sp. NPDC048751 TaxID=3365591 RepID=UPI0037164DF9
MTQGRASGQGAWVERELEELAAWGARVLTAGVWSEDAERVQVAFAVWLEEQGSYQHSLALLDFERHRPDTDPDGFRAEWTRRLRTVLKSRSDAQAADQLKRLVVEFGQVGRSRSSPRVSNTASSTTVNESPVTGDHIDFRGGTFPGQVIGKQYNYGPQPGVGLPDPDSWPTLEDVNPVTLGVRQTRRLGEESGLACYVTRDVDEALRGWRQRDGLLVITGVPLTGKSRTAWTAMFNHLELHTRVYAPPPGTDLRSLPGLLRARPGTYVLWLDELERHLGDQGLDLGLLDELNRLGVPVVATMSDEEYEKHRFGDGPASRLLSRTRPVRLSSRWSEAELERLAEVTDDARLVDAVQWRGDSGVTQYLAVGPELWELWHHAAFSNSRHPLGHLVVKAAIDLVRCGVTGDIPGELLETASGCYGTGHVSGRPEIESLEEALAWAAEQRHGVTGLLVRGESDGTWRPYGSLVADVLRDPTTEPVPLAVWRCALDGTRDDADLYRTVLRTADAHFALRAEEGDPEAMHMLGITADDEATALEWFRKAVDAGKSELAGRVGELLLARGEAEDALPYLRTAAERNPQGAEGRLLGQAHLMLAEHWLRQAAEAGDAEAAHRLGDLLLGGGDIDGAIDHYLDAEMDAYAPVARSVGMFALLKHQAEVAQVYLERAVGAGDERAVTLLDSAREAPETLAEAEEHFLDAGTYPLDATHHGAVLEKKGLLAEARQQYEKGYDLGDAYGAYRLAALLQQQGNPEEATLWYRKAADMGHPAAKKALAEMAEKPATVKE